MLTNVGRVTETEGITYAIDKLQSICNQLDEGLLFQNIQQNTHTLPLSRRLSLPTENLSTPRPRPRPRNEKRKRSISFGGKSKKAKAKNKKKKAKSKKKKKQ